MLECGSSENRDFVDVLIVGVDTIVVAIDDFVYLVSI
jgi:hypothetical protein